MKAYDPVAMRGAAELLPEVTLAVNPYEAARDCDALIIATEWNDQRQLDLGQLRQIMRTPLIVTDAIYDPNAMREQGFIYIGTGRGLPRGYQAGLARNGAMTESVDLIPAGSTRTT